VIARIPSIRPVYIVVGGVSHLAFAALAGLGLGVAVGAGLAVGVVALCALAFASRQEIRVEDGRLVIRDGVGPLAWTRTFEAGDVRELRVEAPTKVGSETIRFDYRGRTHGFAAALDETDAERLLPRIREVLR
jgi:hypothetical protein